ncbi:MAG TPA: sulfatase-like hydrolase/transferase, partial [Acidimicrobiales bacterium]|nr:sulfatase-like hydrolase/transferase [Acidimicrobiales bacterium]
EAFDEAQATLPVQYSLAERPRHRVLEELRRVFAIQGEVGEGLLRRIVTTYYAMGKFLDVQVGRVLAELKRSGLDDRTLVIYTSDHGEMLGDHGLWTKCCFYDGSVAIPLIVAGPGVPVGRASRLSSLVDVFPTVLEWFGIDRVADDGISAPGLSLLSAEDAAGARKFVFAEYHATGFENAGYMIRSDRYKYVEYVDGPPQLFDLVADPRELHDLATSEQHHGVLDAHAATLRSVCDPGATNAAAHADQRAEIERLGGEAKIRSAPMYTYTPVPSEFEPEPDEYAVGE